MFTGIVTEIGSVAAIAPTDGGARLVIDAPGTAAGLVIGDSIAVAGVCLTAIEVEGARFVVEAVAETLARTNLGSLLEGDRVNLERALAAAGRLDGHFVQGHVDGVATVRSLVPDGDSVRVRVEPPAALSGYLVEKGSVALDGVSLTVSRVDATGFEVVLIPHTRAVTTFDQVETGRRLNVEVDVLAKYVARLLEMRS